MSPAARDDLCVAVVGPTAAGKSDLAVELALALGGEVVNADSMQLYRGMDIGTAKLTMAERRGVRHHLLDVLEVTERASVAAYQRAARAVIADCHERGVVPVIAGGSGLYVQAILDQLDFPATDPEVRARWEAELARVGPEVLHATLAQRDPEAASAILPTNGRRIVRALEVGELTGQPFPARLTRPREVAVIEAVRIGLAVPRDELDARITARVDRMFDEGLLDEVRQLEARGLREGVTASRALGYRQVLDLFDGELADEAAARAATVRATRKFARRQGVWFGNDARVHWLPYDAPDLVARALALCA